MSLSEVAGAAPVLFSRRRDRSVYGIEQLSLKRNNLQLSGRAGLGAHQGSPQLQVMLSWELLMLVKASRVLDWMRPSASGMLVVTGGW